MKERYLTAIGIALILSFSVKNIVRLGYILFTNPPSVIMVQNLDEQYQCTRNAGFVFEKPLLRVMRRPYDSDLAAGYADMLFGVITITDYASYTTLAHEIGHIIDGQTNRKGHPFFVGKEKMDGQVLADAIRDLILEECY